MNYLLIEFCYPFAGVLLHIVHEPAKGKSLGSLVMMEKNWKTILVRLVSLVRVFLQHLSTVTTQRYIGLQREEIEAALQNYIKLL